MGKTSQSRTFLTSSLHSSTNTFFQHQLNDSTSTKMGGCGNSSCSCASCGCAPGSCTCNKQAFSLGTPQVRYDGSSSSCHYRTLLVRYEPANPTAIMNSTHHGCSQPEYPRKKINKKLLAVFGRSSAGLRHIFG